MIRAIRLCKEDSIYMIDKMYECYNNYVNKYSDDKDELFPYNTAIDYNKYLYMYGIAQKAGSIIKILPVPSNSASGDDNIEIDYLSVEELLRSLIELTGNFYMCYESYINGISNDFKFNELINELHEQKEIIDNMRSGYKDPHSTLIQRFYDTRNLEIKVIGLITSLKFLEHNFNDKVKDFKDEFWDTIYGIKETNWEESYSIVSKEIDKFINKNYKKTNFTNKAKKALKKIDVYYFPHGNPEEMYLDPHYGLEKTQYPSINMLYKEFSMATHANSGKLNPKPNVLQRLWSYWSILMLNLRSVSSTMELPPPI